MLILPLPARPDWSRPPLVTLGLMLLCVIVFVVGQGGDEERDAAAISFYANSVLPDLELPAFIADLRTRGRSVDADSLERALAGTDPRRVLETMSADRDFMRRLKGGQIITPADARYADWRSARTRYEALRAKVFTEKWSLNAGTPTPATVLSHMFLHGDIMHLAGNLAVLFIVGYTVEAALGGLVFLGLYLLGGVGAAVPDLLFAADRVGYGLGASGAISAVMAAYLVLFGLRRIRFFYWFAFFFGTVRWPALAILPVWIGNELLQRFVFDPHGQVNYLAHFGGFVAGALLAGAYRWRRAGATAESVERIDADLAFAQLHERAVAHVAQMQFDLAAQRYRSLVELRPGDDALLAEYLRVARLTRDESALQDASVRLIERAATPGSAVDALALAQALQGSAAASVRLSNAGWSRLAQGLIAGGAFDAAEALALKLVARDAAGDVAAGVLGSLARALRDAGQAERAERVKRLLLQRYPQLARL
ncbi:rhomboid family intramembrane serine protease [Niveibacterium sp. 24ML]|uniref:rhomboid family intramembrane serine protease n=1 Tax=Niveibacterium sp. 24ML TaxID=2985512 RepID=UPI00226ED894|nr:rhomboid family intramembrane serine protease [Niveibacterium sp. 24ML]MCX9158020.1 rhomboid family intramembrane serine protease [Niveibacterium sp. 24ML]